MSLLKIKKNKEKIVKLLNENIDLEYKLNLKKFTRFSESNINIGTKKEPKIVPVKIGHWKHTHFDSDFPNDKKHSVEIERSEYYEIDGNKSNHWNKITYYSVDDI